jgi:hypothetical protein
MDFLSLHDFSRDPVFVILLAHVFGGGGGGSLKNSAGKYVVKNRLVVSVEEEEARKRYTKGCHECQVPLSSSFRTFSLSCNFSRNPVFAILLAQVFGKGRGRGKKRMGEIRFLDFLSFHNFS